MHFHINIPIISLKKRNFEISQHFLETIYFPKIDQAFLGSACGPWVWAAMVLWLGIIVAFRPRCRTWWAFCYYSSLKNEIFEFHENKKIFLKFWKRLKPDIWNFAAQWGETCELQKWGPTDVFVWAVHSIFPSFLSW